MAALAPGTVSSTSRFHFRVRWGGQRIRIRRKPAAWAAAAPMKVFPVPIAPTTVVPRWAWRDNAAAPDGVGLPAHRGAQQPGQVDLGFRGPVEGRVGLHHPLGDGVFEGVYES